eukprot:5906455-Amphidinium_carterae.1
MCEVQKTFFEEQLVTYSQPTVVEAKVEFTNKQVGAETCAVLKTIIECGGVAPTNEACDVVTT